MTQGSEPFTQMAAVAAVNWRPSRPVRSKTGLATEVARRSHHQHGHRHNENPASPCRSGRLAHLRTTGRSRTLLSAKAENYRQGKQCDRQGKGSDSELLSRSPPRRACDQHPPDDQTDRSRHKADRKQRESPGLSRLRLTRRSLRAGSHMENGRPRTVPAWDYEGFGRR